ncbi:MAG: 3-phosphoshikimate 1-carboxyvinyltransferase [Polyangiaceae bacterium]
MVVHLEAPSSKSMTQRSLLIGALCPEPSVIERALLCDDSRYLSGLLETLGCEIDWTSTATEGDADAPPHEVALRPAATWRRPTEPLYCGNAGTAVRFGSCLSLLLDEPLVIDGDPHMRKRPIGALSDSLRQLGVDVQHLEREGCPPIALRRTKEAPSVVEVDASLSSQYASGLLMIAPRLPSGLTVKLTTPQDTALVSMPYVEMTLSMMRAAGAAIDRPSQDTIVVAGSGYQLPAATTRRVAIESDWSAASFLLAAGEIIGTEVVLPGLLSPESSLQGDSAFAHMLAQIDQQPVNRFDLSDTPDLIAPLVARCLYARHPTEIRGAAHTRIKECDRVAVLCRELSKIGAEMIPRPDGIDMKPLSQAALTNDSAPVTLDPDSDHRMAMAFGIVSLRAPSIRVAEPACVSKSFPNFWAALDSLREHDRGILT